MHVCTHVRVRRSKYWNWSPKPQQPPYSPGLAPSDFSLFPHLKKHLGERSFTSNEEVIRQTRSLFAKRGGYLPNEILKEFSRSYIFEALKNVEKGWKMYVFLNDPRTLNE